MRPLNDTDPTMIGSYRLLGVLGNGGMGRVFLGQSKSGRPVAIKVIRPDLVNDPVFRRRFAREVAAVREVNPLFTAAVVDSDLTSPEPWLATTYIEGPSLERWVDGHGALSPGAVLTLAAGLAEALTEIHAAGLVHRDLKPSNVLLGDVGPYIIDFGVVLSPKATRMTNSLVVGTPSYMAPERIHGGEATPSTDVFALGATMYYAATGRTLVDDSDTVYAQMMSIIKGKFDFGRVPSELRPMIMRCLSPDQRDRPTAAELSHILAEAGVSAPEPGWHQAISDVPFSAVLTPRRIRRSSRRRVLLAGGLVALATVGGVGAGLIGRYLRDDGTDGTDGPPGGALLWQGRSGAEPVPVIYGLPPSSTSPGQGGGPGSGRPEPVAVWLVPLGERAMAAGTRSGVRAGGPDSAYRWNRPVPDGLVALYRWGDSVLVAGAGALARVGLKTGDELGRFDSGAVRRVAVTATAAYVGAGGATRLNPPGTAPTGSTAAPANGAYLAAVDRDLKPVWRRPGGGTPIYADDTRVLTYDPMGNGLVRIVLHDAATGNPLWTANLPAPAVVDEDSMEAAGPPPNDRPDKSEGPGGPGGPPPDGGRGRPPAYQYSWNYTQAVISDEFAVVRSSSKIWSLRMADGTVAWEDSTPTPITDLDLAGDLVLVAADRVSARRPDSGKQQWQAGPPGSRVTVAPGRAVIIASPDGQVLARTPAGGRLWESELPEDARYGVPDHLVVDGDQVIITMAPQPGQTLQPEAVDVVAFRI